MGAIAALVLTAIAISACDPPTAPSATGGGGHVQSPIHAPQRIATTSDDITR